MIKLRDYQQEVKDGVYEAWDSGLRNVLAVLPTGAGKTVLFSDIIRDHQRVPTVCIAHRQELVSQISVALARDEVRHKIIAPINVIKLVVSLHVQETGRSYYDANSHTAVAGVDTLVIRKNIDRWAESVKLWVMDEAHHVLQNNKWGSAVSMFPNAKGLGVTATPCRTDGKGLGSHADGYFDKMIVGPSMRNLIDRGFLTDYRVFCPTSDINLIDVQISKATGDYNPDQLRKAVRKSHITGDVVKGYLEFANGKLGVTFATDVEIATEIAANFNASGVKAAVVSAKTPEAERIATIRKFRNKEILQLVNVDLFGEGFDLPAIESVHFARPTESFGLFTQQFGRGLRLMEDKNQALIIDHVGNVMRHGLPDAPRVWSLDRRDSRGSKKADDVQPIRVCAECTGVYERFLSTCPYCGYTHKPAARSSIEFVEGAISELSPEILRVMLGRVEDTEVSEHIIRAKCANKNMPLLGQLREVKRHEERKAAQMLLRATINLWCNKYPQASLEEVQRRFYYNFGIDILSAQTLYKDDALKLNERVLNECFA